jgi:Tfp pilus assembly protein PilN
VIEQQINFYQDQFKEKRLFASAVQVIILLLVMLIGIAGWSYLIGANLSDLEQQNLTLKASQSLVNNELTVAPAELNRQLADDRITNQVNNIAKQLRTRKQVLRFIENNQFGSGEGFSDYLNSLSNLRIDDVWLDEISLSNSFLKIRGSALRADLIPTYFASFREEDVFRGQRFQLFELDRKPDTDWKVDFTIATEEAFGEE